MRVKMVPEQPLIGTLSTATPEVDSIEMPYISAVPFMLTVARESGCWKVHSIRVTPLLAAEICWVCPAHVAEKLAALLPNNNTIRLKVLVLAKVRELVIDDIDTEALPYTSATLAINP